MYHAFVLLLCFLFTPEAWATLNDSDIWFPMFNYDVRGAQDTSHLDLTLGYMTGSSRKPGNLEYSRPGLTISGALTFALTHLRQSQYFDSNLQIRFRLIVTETCGDEEESIRQVAALWKIHNVSVIIGPQETCLHEAKLAASLNIPMISYFCSDEETSDKKQFSTFSRTRPPDAAISRAIVSLVLKYGWTKSVVVIYSDSADDPRFKRGAKSLSILFREKGVSVLQTIPYRGPYHHGFMENPFDSIVAQTKEVTRIYIIISEYFEHLGLVLALRKHNLLDNGEYLVIGVSMDDYKEEEWNPQRYFRGLLRDETEAEAPRAFRSYLGIVASPPKNYTEFSRQVNRYMEMPPFDWPNPLARVGGFKKIRIEAAYLYDAVLLYAHAIRSILSSGANVLDGQEVSRRMRNISFRSATGHESKMDVNGDAEGNFTLVTLKQRNREYGLYPVGYFVQDGDLPALALRETIDWVSGSPPEPEPPCGFFGEKCQTDNSSIIATGIFLFVMVFLGSAIYLAFRHWRLSKDIDTLMWKIDKRDIQWETSHLFPNGRGIGGSPSTASLARFSTVFAPLVTYRERIFAAKRLETGILLDAPLKHQLKMLREIRHENLNAFIGACQYEDGLLLVNEYCSRGSIKDILENGDLKLDEMFISSLVGDLLRGLSYLHDSSSFRFHGNLKPTNCLIDSRWVLKLSDFGLTFGSISSKRITDPSYGSNSTPYSFHQHHGGGGGTRVSFTHGHGHTQQTSSSLLPKPCQSPYLPPEYTLICSGHVKNITEGFRKGDMYSLGVILWELLRRESLGSFLGLKKDADIRSEICQDTSGSSRVPFWTRALGALASSSPARRTSLIQPATGTQNPLKYPPNNKLHGLLSPATPASTTTLRNNQKNCSALERSGGETSSTLISAQVLECLETCLQFDPELRPDIKIARSRLRPLHKGMRSNIFDTMIGLMEKYANNLEKLVDERTKQLSEEKRKTDILLYELIPASVAEELKEGLRVPAQNYDCVSIYFSDIVGFTSMSAQSTALQVVEFLNDLYTCFDSVIENFDVYKVETIGDAYMVASGLPVAREGNFHALEMARMALKLLRAVKNFQIRHRPDETLKLRIGLHSGPVCAGVVGQKRPRYCLFGDTVNTASRMESTGLPLRIHCSEVFVNLLGDSFECEKRGMVDVKGKGDMMTFWLIREKNLPSPSSSGSL